MSSVLHRAHFSVDVAALHKVEIVLFVILSSQFQFFSLVDCHFRQKHCFYVILSEGRSP